MLFRSKQKGQSVLEYCVLIIIVIGVFIAMQVYIKRGFQGRWKDTVDDFGDQYDPRLVNSHIVHTRVANADSQLIAQTDSGTGKSWTQRIDTTNVEETRNGFINVGAPDPDVVEPGI